MDDTDSLKLGCTTYIGALLIENLAKKSKFVDYPNLIRLNPNIPWKSRGNAGICLRFLSDRAPEDLLDLAEGLAEEYRDREDAKNQPGIALLEGETPRAVKEFGRRALYNVLTKEEAFSAAEKVKAKYRIIRGGLGLVGALASIGNTLEADHTFELVVYRKRELWGRKRNVDLESVVKFDKETNPLTFNNIDYEKGRLLVTPHGPDPILFGVRGESPQVVMEALTKVKFKGAERWVVYRSNQGTASHLVRTLSIKELKPYQAAILKGKISKASKVLKGGHVIAYLKDRTGEIDMAGYEPSGSFRMVVRDLLPGDRVRAYGGVRVLDDGRFTFNLERLEVLELVNEVYRNPVCPKCGKSMKSEGKGKGYQCERCGLKTREPTLERIERKIKAGAYLPPPRAMRHLTKPFQRYGQEKTAWNGRVGEFYGLF
jgi:tRNA(Ile2)-agmatinylcytidine synthase